MLFETGENTFGFVLTPDTTDVFLKNQQSFTVTFFGSRYPLEIDEVYAALNDFQQFGNCKIHVRRDKGTYHGAKDRR